MFAKAIVASIVAVLVATLFLPAPQNLRTRFDDAQSYYAIGEYDFAIKEFSKIVNFQNKAVDPSRVQVKITEKLELPIVVASWYQLGNSYKKKGDYTKAIESYRQIVKGTGTGPEIPVEYQKDIIKGTKVLVKKGVIGVSEDFRAQVQYQIAETRFFEKENLQAAEEYGNYISLFPNGSDIDKAYFYKGWSYFNATDYDNCVSTLTELLSKYPQSKYLADAQFRIASAYFEAKKFDKSIEEAQKVLDRYPDSPVIASAEYLKAQSDDKLEQYDEAIVSYQKVIDLYNKMFELLRASFREGKNIDFEDYKRLFETSFLRIAEIYRDNKKDFPKAYETYVRSQETVKERDYIAKVQMLIGDNYMTAKQYDKAKESYNLTITNYSDTPYPPQAQYMKGESDYYAGKYADARTEYLKLSELFPDADVTLQSQSLYAAGYCSEQLGEKDKALEQYGLVVSKYPRSTQAPLSLMRSGRILYDQNKYQESIQIGEKILKDYSESTSVNEANYVLGLDWLGLKNLDKALVAFNKVPTNAGEVYVASQMSIGRIYLEQKKNAEAEKTLSDILTAIAGKKDLEAITHMQIAQLYSSTGQYDKAASEFTLLIDQYAENISLNDAYFGRARAYHELKKFSLAETDYEYLLKQANLSDDLKVKTQLSLGLLYSAIGKEADAENLLRIVSNSSDKPLAQAARIQLVSLAEKKSPQQAIQTYKQLLVDAKDDKEVKESVLPRLANAYYKVDQYQESLNTARQLINMGGGNPESIASSYFLIGNCYFKQEQFEKAIEEYQHVINDYPKTAVAPDALFQIGSSYNNLSKNSLKYLDQTIDSFSQYFKQYPGQSDALQAMYYTGWGYYRQGEWQKAASNFEALADKAPQGRFAPEALFRAGESYFNLTKWNEAIAVFKKSVSRYPKGQYADASLYSWAWALINMQKQADAIPVFRRIVAEYPKGKYAPWSQFTLGDYYYSLTPPDYKKAAEEYQKFLTMFPNSDKASRAKQLLDNLAEIDAYNVYKKGEDLYDQKKYDDALKIFIEVIAKFPKSLQAANAKVNTGAVYMIREDFPKAKEIFTGVVRDYGNDPKFSSQVEFAKSQLQELKKAF